MQADIVVLGAGIVGVSSALHLQAAGLRVVLLDRAAPGSGTSHGNAGLIERSSIVPYAFPRSPLRLARYALNREPDVRYNPLHLPRMAGWLARYWHHSAPAPLAEATAAMWPLIQRCVSEHDALIEAAGLHHLIGGRGWIELFRTPQAFAQAQREAQSLAAYELKFAALNHAALTQLQPGISDRAVGALHWLEPKTVRDPGALVRGYAQLFTQRGGVLVRGDALGLKPVEDGWQVQGVRAKQVVVALGLQAGGLCERLGYRVPLAVKRGYHLHFAQPAHDPLEYSVCDSQSGFVLAPMARGIRLTTGVEFDAADAPANRILLSRTEKLARQLFALGEAVDAEPWLGCRPCLPDMRPVIGAAPGHAGLWFNFGHAHHGLTLGPVSGRLLAQLVTGQTPFTDPAPYRATRFEGVARART